MYTISPAAWCGGYHYCITLLNKVRNQVLRRLKSCSRRVGGSGWRGSLTMVPAGDKAKRLSSVNDSAKTIYHHHEGRFLSDDDDDDDDDDDEKIQFQVFIRLLTCSLAFRPRKMCDVRFSTTVWF